ncbi:MAG: DUF3616 domain-containing protein [Verrucomicrobiae bacterium]|nr:DUF3616 domain-containing protein [Verrucomicrobiae bacterium]
MKTIQCITVLALSLAIPATAGFRMEITDEPWHLAGFENPLDLSAVAAATRTMLLVGSDEMFHVQPGVLDPETLRIESRRPIALPLEPPDEKAEVDIEGIAWSAETSAYYVTGSHGVGKKKGDVQPARLTLFRVPADADGSIRREDITRTSLEPWFEQTPELEPYLHAPLQKNGLNIEGLAARDGKLFIGLRAPNIGGDGIVLELPADVPFTGAPAAMKLHRIALGEGRGIREIVAVEGGFILATGNASAPPSKKIPVSKVEHPDTRFDLRFWNGRDPRAEMLGTLPQNGGKAEGLLVLHETRDRIKLLVVFDSLLAGEPMGVVIHR